MQIASWYRQEGSDIIALPIYECPGAYCYVLWKEEETHEEVYKRASGKEYYGPYDTVSFWQDREYDPEDPSIKCHIYEIKCYIEKTDWFLISLYEFGDDEFFNCAVCLKHNRMNVLAFMKDFFLPFGTYSDIKWGF